MRPPSNTMSISWFGTSLPLEAANCAEKFRPELSTVLENFVRDHSFAGQGDGRGICPGWNLHDRLVRIEVSCNAAALWIVRNPNGNGRGIQDCLQLSGSLFHEALEIFIEATKLLLRLFALGDVLDRAMQPFHPAFGVEVGQSVDGNPSSAAVLTRNLQITVIGLAGFEGSPHKAFQYRQTAGTGERPASRERRSRQGGIVAENSVQFFRPMERIIPGVPTPATHMADALGFEELRFTLA